MNLHYSLDDARDAGDAPWSEFHPNLCKLSLTLQSKETGNHTEEVTFGFRKIATMTTFPISANW
jgi:hypothetical protein